MTREEAIEILLTADFPEYYTIGEVKQVLNMAIQSLTAISELSKSLKAVNRYDMDEKVLIGFNMAVAIFNKCFGESGALKNEQSEQNVGMCQQNVGEMSEKQTDGDLISRTDLLNKIWQKEYGKDYDGVNMLSIPHIDIIENMPSTEKTAEWIETFSGNGQLWYKCSNCNATGYLYKRKICLNCGSKMKGESE